MFNFLRDCQTVFWNSCAILHSSQECMRVPGLSTSLSILGMIPILISIEWYCGFFPFPQWLIMLSIFACVYLSSISLHCQSVSTDLLLKKKKKFLFAFFKTWVFIIEFRQFSIYSGYRSPPRQMFSELFFYQSSICLFILLTSFWGTEGFNFVEGQFINLFLYGWCFGGISYLLLGNYLCLKLGITGAD